MSLELTATDLLLQLQSLLPLSHPENNSPALKILVAYSGGLDSHVLLHLLSEIPQRDIHLRATYINHGLQAEANDWALHCENICKNLKVAFQSIDLHLSVPKGESIEEVARQSRYQALAANILEDEILVTAHHQNDQAETLLLQLFRGAGVQGLASMSVKNTFNLRRNFHIRPLLGYSRNALEEYAEKYHLNYIEDPSNKDTAFDRNLLRQKIMPDLRQRWQGIDKAISRAASIQGETKELLDEIAAEELPNVLTKDAYYTETTNSLSLAPISIVKLRELSINKQRLVLRYWISQQGFTNPSETKLAHIFSDLLDAANDKQPLLKWTGVELRRFKDCLYIMPPLSKHEPSQIFDWAIEDTLTIESLNISFDSSILNPVIIQQQKRVNVRFRQGGETIELPKRGKLNLKNYLQEQQVPSWVRSRLPLIYLNDKLVQIIGLNEYKRHPPTF